MTDVKVLLEKLLNERDAAERGDSDSSSLDGVTPLFQLQVAEWPKAAESDLLTTLLRSYGSKG